MTHLICIVCPKGCHLSVDEEGDFLVTGHDCVRGEAYGIKEVTDPTRVLTSVVYIDNAAYACCPVKTSGAIPKAKLTEAMQLLRTIRLRAPVSIGDVVARNICGTGTDWVITRDLPKKEK